MNTFNTQNDTAWSVEDGNIELFHIEEQHCLFLTRDDLLKMLQELNETNNLTTENK